MKPTNHRIQSDNNLRSVSAQARLLMSQCRQRKQNRIQSMLQRAASEIGIER
ncbi:hypothetical protein IQ238_05545 [Pleurocapsales cyanobacterium LEGE 06147]|nr:hypothetical protein [Pleurocapsales cyanobacterium LEGE 06147]